jgi:hypothetical protein
MPKANAFSKIGFRFFLVICCKSTPKKELSSHISSHGFDANPRLGEYTFATDTSANEKSNAVSFSFFAIYIEQQTISLMSRH